MKLYNLINEQKIFIPRDVQGRQQEYVKQLLIQLNQPIIYKDIILYMYKFPQGTKFLMKQIKGGVEIINIEIGDLSYFKNLQKVDGYFYCNFNELTSLKGCPEYVGGDFLCGFNNLTSLQGAPKEVGGDFLCRSQKSDVKFTQQDVKKVSNVKGKIYV